jgi:hypothetical protein
LATIAASDASRGPTEFCRAMASGIIWVIAAAGVAGSGGAAPATGALGCVLGTAVAAGRAKAAELGCGRDAPCATSSGLDAAGSGTTVAVGTVAVAAGGSASVEV